MLEIGMTPLGLSLKMSSSYRYYSGIFKALRKISHIYNKFLILTLFFCILMCDIVLHTSSIFLLKVVEISSHFSNLSFIFICGLNQDFLIYHIFCNHSFNMEKASSFVSFLCF